MRRSKQTQNKRGIGSLLKLLRYVARFKWRILLILLAVLAANLVGLRIPDITGQLVDCMAAPGGVDFSALGWGVLEIVFLALVTFGLSALQNILMLKTAQDLVLSLRHDAFSKLVALPVSYFDQNTKGNILSILSVDIDNISDTISSDVITLLTGFVTVVGSLAMMLAISPLMTLIFAVTVPAMILLSRVVSKRSRRLFREKKNCFGELCGYAEEMITAQKTVKVYGLEDYNESIFRDISHRLRESGAKAEFVSSTMMPSMNGINNLNFTLICAFGAFLVLSGRLSIGAISSFVLYSKKFATPIVDTANIVNMFQSALAACDRVFTILDADTEPGYALPAGDAPAALGQAPARTALAKEILRAMDDLYRDFPQEKAQYLEQYRRDCLTLGRPVTVLRPSGARNGFATGINEDFSLTVRWEDGTEEALSAGEVSVRGLYGYV